jgi:hypothetical protein
MSLHECRNLYLRGCGKNVDLQHKTVAKETDGMEKTLLNKMTERKTEGNGRDERKFWIRV